MNFFSIKSSELNLRNEKNNRKKKVFAIEITFIVILVITNFIIGDFLRENILNVLWLDTDDALNSNVANSFREEKNFELDFRSYYIFQYDINETFRLYPTISTEYGGKGPIFYILLGTFYEMLDTKPGDFYYHGSIFGNIISSSFLILFFLVIKRYFNLRIAIFSSLLVLLTPFLSWNSARILPIGLFPVFAISAFFFLKKSNSHYFFYALFAGLSHLTHPFGIWIAISYPIFLLFNKEFKGFVITFLTWIGVLFPWFVRNYYEFKQIGVGLYIPFSTEISSLFSFLPSKVVHPTIYDYFPQERLSEVTINIFATLWGTLENINDLYNMDFLIIFLLIFTGFAFFKLDKLQKNLKIVFLFFYSVIITLIAASFAITDSSLQIFFVLGLPIILVLLLWKFNNSLFIRPIPRFNSFVLFFGIFSVLGYFYTAFFFDREVPTTRQLMFLFFLLTPIAIFGLENIINTVKSKIPRINSKTTGILIVGLVLLPISTQLVYGIYEINNFWSDRLPAYRWQSENSKQLNLWADKNVPKDAIVMTNLPSRAFLGTGLKAIHMPPPWLESTFDEENIIKFMKFYHVTHIFFYDVPLWSVAHIYAAINNPFSGSTYELIYTLGNSQIIKNESILNANISEPSLYFKKANFLDAYGNKDEAKKIYTEIEFSNYQLETNELLIMCDKLNEYGMVERALSRCVDYEKSYFLKKGTEPGKKIYEIQNIINDFLDEQKYYKKLEKYEKIIYLGNFNENFLIDLLKFSIHLNKDPEIIITFYDSLIDYYKYQIDSYRRKDFDKFQSLEQTLIQALKSKANFLLNQEDYHKAYYVYQEVVSINKFDADIWKKQGQYHEIQGSLGQAIQAYEFALQLEPRNQFLIEKIKELKSEL